MIEELQNKTVEDYLAEVNYDPNAFYVPSEFALSFINFVKLVNGSEGEENETPIIHYKWLDEIADSNKHVVNMCFRGSAKSSVLAEYLFLYLALYGELPGVGKINYALYVSDSIDNGVAKMRLRIERRYQNSKFLQEYIPEIKFTITRWYFKNAAGKEFVVSGFGARTGVRGPLALDELVYTDRGTRTIESIQKGDLVYTPEGHNAQVIDKSEIQHTKMYKLTFEDGRSLKVSDNHLNALYCKKLNLLKDMVKTNILTSALVNDIKADGIKGKYGYRYYMQTVKPTAYSKKNFVLDPYLVGLMLGDGNITDGKGVKITGLPEDVSFYYEQLKNKYNISLYIQPDKRENHLELLRASVHGIGQEVKALGLNGVKAKQKAIPREYLFGSVEQRKALLAGLLDTDGAVAKKTGSVSYTTISKALAEGIQELGRSLGMYVYCKSSERPGNRHDLYRLNFVGSFNPFRLDSKACYWKRSPRWKEYIALIDIEEIAEEPSVCILLDDPKHEFITTGYIPTHNTIELNSRPQLAILDDLISDEDARSDTIISSIEDVVYKAIDYALHPTRNKIIWSGTPFNARDPLYKAVESGAWAVNVYPVCEEFPCAEEDFRSAWGDRFTYKYVLDKYTKAYQAGKIDTFNQELMLRIMSDEDRLIEDQDIIWFSRRKVLENQGAYNFYITTDFATTERASGDFSVISVWAYNNNGDWMWTDGICKKQLMDKNIDDLFTLAQKYRPQSVGIEISGQQKGFISWIQKEMLERNIYFNLAKEDGSNQFGIRPNTNKMQRFNVVVPLFKLGKIWFPEELGDSDIMHEAMNELSLASQKGFKSKHDDFLDTISMLGVIKAWKPSQVAPATAPERQRYWLDQDDQDDGPRVLDRYVI